MQTEFHAVQKTTCDMVMTFKCAGIHERHRQVLGLNSIHLYMTYKPKTFCEYGPRSIKDIKDTKDIV